MASSPTSSRKESDIQLDTMKDKLGPHKQSDSFIPLTSDAIAHMDNDLLTRSKEASPVIIGGAEDNVLQITTVFNDQIADDTLVEHNIMASSTTSSRGENDIQLNTMKAKLEPHKQSDSSILLTSDAVAYVDDDLLTCSKEPSAVSIGGEEDNVSEITTVSNDLIIDDTLVNNPATSEGTSSYCYFKNFMIKF